MIIGSINNHQMNYKTANLSAASAVGATANAGGSISAISGSSASNYDDSQPGSRNFASLVHGFADNFGGLF